MATNKKTNIASKRVKGKDDDGADDDQEDKNYKLNLSGDSITLLLSIPPLELIKDVETTGLKLKNHSQGRPADFKKALGKLQSYVEVLQTANENLEEQLKGMTALERRNGKLEEKMAAMEESMMKQERAMQEREKNLEQTLRTTMEEEVKKQKQHFEEMMRKQDQQSSGDDLHKIIQATVNTQFQDLLADEIRQEVSAAIKRIFGEKDEIQQVIATAIKEAMLEKQSNISARESPQQQQPTYAQKLMTSTIKRSHPTLILNPINKDTPTNGIREQLNKIPAYEMGVTS